MLRRKLFTWTVCVASSPDVTTCGEMIGSSGLAVVVLLGLMGMCDAVFQGGATCYQASSVPWDAGILEHRQPRMQTIQVKPHSLHGHVHVSHMQSV